MQTFVEALEEIATGGPVISIPSEEVERLVERYGSRVRMMGRWNVSTDASLDIPIAVIQEAAHEMGSQALLNALAEIKADPLKEFLDSSAAVSLIDKIGEISERHLRNLMTRYQEASDPDEVIQLRDQLVREVFGK